MTYDWQIKPGDTVKVFPTERDFSYYAVVKSMPQATGDAWVFEDKYGGICYQQTYNRIILMQRRTDDINCEGKS